MTMLHRIGLSLLVVALCVGTTFAQEKGEKKKKKGPQTPGQVAQLQKQLGGLDLTAEQKTKIDELLKSHGAKIAELQGKSNGLLSPEQRKARAEAIAKAKADGKKGAELAAAISDAVKMTAEQRKQSDESAAQLKELVESMRKEVNAVLSPEQQAKLAPAKTKKKKKAD